MENIQKKKYCCEVDISARMRNFQKSHVLSVQELGKLPKYMRSRFTIYYHKEISLSNELSGPDVPC